MDDTSDNTTHRRALLRLLEAVDSLPAEERILASEILAGSLDGKEAVADRGPAYRRLMRRLRGPLNQPPKPPTTTNA